MINFETNNSAYFIQNKNYCETIESKLQTINVDCSGWCNSFGYEMNATLKKDNLIYHIKFHKHQSTQSGVIIPVDAIDYAGVELIVTGLNKKLVATVGKSSLSRFFISKKFKDKIPSPYFIKFNYSPDDHLIDNLVNKVQLQQISKLKLHHGKLRCTIHQATPNPLDLIAEIDKMTKNWT